MSPSFLPTQSFSDAVVRLVADHYGITVAKLRIPRRHRTLTRARWIAAHILRSETSLSYPEIGSLLGGFDHSTVIYGVQKIRAMMAESRELALIIDRLRSNARELRTAERTGVEPPTGIEPATSPIPTGRSTS